MLKILFASLWAFRPEILSRNKEVNPPVTTPDPRFDKAKEDGAAVDYNPKVGDGKLSKLKGISCNRY
jgi:hypothetical protein